MRYPRPVPGSRGMSIRPFAIVLVAALGLAGASPGGSKTAPPTIRTQPTFFISGHGWGHGLGMSQYGAYGYAQHGWTYDRILKHYYTGTTIGQAPVSRVRVLLLDSKKATIASKLPFQVVDATGSKHALDAGSYAVGPGFKYTDPTNSQAKPAALPYPLEFRPGATALSLNGRGYRGSLRVLKLTPAKVRIVNVVDLDFYIRGVVPSEMPKTWAPEALKAQAVAARSYALSHLHAAAGFDLYPDTRDQVYLGIPHEAPSTNAAVNATAGQVVLYKGKVASTYFFSTSGGATTPLPYGTAPALSGPARGVSSAELQQLGSAGDWQTVSTLIPRGGSVAPRVKPQQSSQFRLAVGKIASDPVPVAVAPSVRLHVPAQLTGFWGAVKPAAAGTTVTVQRQAGAAWRAVARVKTTAQGRFTVPRAVAPGTYRARVSAKGFAPGLSKPDTA